MNMALFITARLKSTRLPRKVLLDLNGKTVIQQLVDRVKRARLVDLFVLCTSVNPADDELVEVAEKNGISIFRGHEEDVLVRYRDACRYFGVDFFTVTWGDEPLCDPDYIDKVLAAGVREFADYVYTEDLPTGIFTYGVRSRALEKVCENKGDEFTEVWGRYFMDNSLIKKVKIIAKPKHRRNDIRLTLDYPEDLILLRAIYEKLGSKGRYFSLDKIISFLDANPELKLINIHREAEYLERIEHQASYRLKS